MKARHKRFILVAVGIVAVGIAAALTINALQSNIAYFFSPSQVAAGDAPQGHVFRIGGMVEKGSLRRQGEGLDVEFVVSDTAERVTIRYSGILPDMFGEGQGVVAKGRLGPDRVFIAEQVLAKHDESYMPPEVADAIETAQKMGVVNKTHGPKE